MDPQGSLLVNQPVGGWNGWGASLLEFSACEYHCSGIPKILDQG
jgi:hypothetical protein